MLCSFCKNIKFLGKFQMCKSGHLLCNGCDDKSSNCVICKVKIENSIQIETENQIPRLIITPISSSPSSLPSSYPSSVSLSSKESNDEHLNFLESDSASTINQIMNQLNKCDNDNTQANENPIFGCFQVIAHKKDHLAYMLSLNSESEVQNFKISSQIALTKKRSVGTVVSNLHLKKTNPVNSSRCSGLSFTTRSDCSGNSRSYDTETSFKQFFMNSLPLNDSETDDAISHVEVKKPFLPYRVKLVPFLNSYDEIPLQMEPMENFDYFSTSHEEQNNEKEIEISRKPRLCPITACKMIFTPLDFCNHIIFDHPYVQRKKLATNQVFNFKLKLAENINVVQCHRIFFLKMKTKGLNYKNCLPVLLLTSKIDLRAIFGNSKSKKNSFDEVTLIWLSTVFDESVKYSFNVWTHHDGGYIKVISTTTSTLDEQRSFKCLGQGFLNLNQNEIKRLTCENENLLNCQIIFG
ncbi:hypothetical protein PVAND_003299 [Polypedilum vanderplanki]|uniref:DUF4729 domain-containing protein n=1 Tax=Polypedilum vanderplanki TaxID=319348 RepID=A0A9J6BUP8_POLVA|nr:hypothetical protein PVAND_003299 [Polypedilum vanderplanki]